MFHEKTVNTEGDKGIPLLLVFSSAIAHREFSGPIRVLVQQAQKFGQGVYSLKRKGMRKRICLVYLNIAYAFHKEEHHFVFFFPLSTCFKNRINPLQQSVMMTLWFKWCSCLQHGKAFGLKGKHPCPEVAERA